ncbi:DUF2249 domain-containing protein [Herbaspirillum sp. RV1423]|uniref:DUF2249 domain-containing protein n=1 Tax=Herbaspirillum sp. RV1423 TaxID=1443993 RepID=UPI0005512BE3|nr:DUF2249 domain-containing protein [Herbaspirillum sp. RV1423]
MDLEISLDVRGLAPPEPLERVLDTLAAIGAQQKLRVLIGREPIPLFVILDKNGYAHSMSRRSASLFEILIWRR